MHATTESGEDEDGQPQEHEGAAQADRAKPQAGPYLLDASTQEKVGELSKKQAKAVKNSLSKSKRKSRPRV